MIIRRAGKNSLELSSEIAVCGKHFSLPPECVAKAHHSAFLAFSHCRAWN